MFGGKTREIMAALEEREAELKALKETLKQRETENASMRIQLDGYKRDREAVLNALTEAQEAARRIIAQAEVRSEDMLREAEEKSKSICERRDGMIAEAESQAQAIIERAEACAKESGERAAAKVSEAEEHAKRFREYVKSTADNIKRQAEEYAEFLSGAAGAAEQNKVELPQDYKNPAELMRTIFAIQGRDIPHAEAEKQQAQPEKEPPAPEAAPVLNIVREQDAHGQAEDDKLWTVDEVMHDDKRAQNSVDDVLNAIIGDVLKLD